MPLIRPSRWTLAAVALCVLGALLRLTHLWAMEFKGDEREALALANRLLEAYPLSNPASWPTHGQISSNGVANAPLFTWIIAGAWAIGSDPVRVAQLIALANAACLFPLWSWARRRMDEPRALLTLALAAVSPFAVVFSRKIWTQDLLLPGVVALLWGLEWWRGERPWRGLVLLAGATLLVGQLHQSGLIAMALLPLAMAWQTWIDRGHGPRRPLGRPSPVEAAALAIVLGLNVFFWAPYARYLQDVPAETLANRPVVHAWVVFTIPLLRKVVQQVIPIDLLFFVQPDRDAFLHGPIRAAALGASLVLGAPLLVYGLWRWMRRPGTLPVLGVWWWGIIALFTVARIHCYPFYVLTLAPITAVLPAGAFDGRMPWAWMTRWIMPWRWAYVASLFVLTLATGMWIVDRGGSMGDYGVIYAVREAQARAAIGLLDGDGMRRASRLNEVGPGDGVPLSCGLMPDETRWLARWLDPRHRDVPATFGVCDTWVARGGDRVYRWMVRDAGPGQ